MLLHFPQYLRALRQQQGFVALRDFSFSVHKGETFGIIGKNGSGKSTTLGLIAGVLKQSGGSIRINGRVSPLLELGAGFHPELTGRDNIILNGILLGMTRRQVEERLDDIIEFSEMREFILRPLKTYSSGMVARLGFSVVVHLDPEILLIDEVLAVGDEEFQDKCQLKMEEFRSKGITIVFVSHDLDDVERICDRVLFLDEGHSKVIGPPVEVVAEYRKQVKRY
ncbi:MAG: ABC transporter ATP-binding protein [Desulfobacterales bacterium]|nr:ABC transporter ATP-binding protein [Desulfobacterales bacterium]